MQKFPIEHVVSGPHLFRAYDHAVMRSILEALVPANALVLLASKAFEGDGLAPLREQWYDTPYGIEALGDERIAQVRLPGGRNAGRVPCVQVVYVLFLACRR
jgi:secreted Zn-dependent insulinase-like peptidase